MNKLQITIKVKNQTGNSQISYDIVLFQIFPITRPGSTASK